MMFRQRGFSLVELIMVMTLTGIISAVGMSFFAQSDAFSALAARDRLVALGDVAQARALANSGDASSVTFSIQQTASLFILSVYQGSTELMSDRIERASLSLSLNGSSMSDGQTHTLTYAHNAATGANYGWVFNGDSAHSACITSTGFSHRGQCQP